MDTEGKQAELDHMNGVKREYAESIPALDDLQAIIDCREQEIKDLTQQIAKLSEVASRAIQDRVDKNAVDSERRQLWMATAVAASHQFLDEAQPARVADAVLAAFDKRWGGVVEVEDEVPVAVRKDPVDSILNAFGVDRVDKDPL